MNTNQNEYEKAVSEMDNAYVLYAFWSHELKHDDQILEELYSEFCLTRKKVQDLYASLSEE